MEITATLFICNDYSNINKLNEFDELVHKNIETHLAHPVNKYLHISPQHTSAMILASAHGHHDTATIGNVT